MVRAGRYRDVRAGDQGDHLKSEDGVAIRFLRPAEAGLLGEAIAVAYGDSYDAAWVYDVEEVERRLDDGTLVSCIAEAADGSLLCHCGLTRSPVTSLVGEAGQAVTMPAARGHHLFTHVKSHMADWARQAGMYGIFSEATTAHPYSEKANIDLGAHEAGFLLGLIPASVSNDAATTDRSGRRSAALFYLKTNDGHDRPVFVPPRHREAVAEIVEVCGLRGRIDTASPAPLTGKTVIHQEVREDHNLAVVTVERAGADIVETVEKTRDALFGTGLDAVYFDLPLDRAETEAAGEALDDVGVTFAGVFPNARVEGDVLRLQSLNDVHVSIDDISTVSEHGRSLLGYVIADHERHNPPSNRIV